MTKPTMPTETLIQCISPDGSADYMDGDDPGYAWCHYDEQAGQLVLYYEPDESPDLDLEYQPRYSATRRVFREVPDA